MRDLDPIQTAVREARQREREERGLAVAPCVFCIEEHHTGQRNHEPKLTDRLCQKHHWQQHEKLRCLGISARYESNRVKRVALILRSTACYDRDRADALERWAQLLEAELLKKRTRTRKAAKPKRPKSKTPKPERNKK